MINGIDHALTAQGTDEVVLPLLTLRHNSISETLRFVANTENIVANGETHIAFPFEITLPSDDGNTPRCQLTIPNIDRRIDQAARDIVGSPIADIAIIATDDPDSPLTELRGLLLKDVEGDVERIQGTLQAHDQTQEPYPWRRSTEDRFPGVRKPT